MATTRKTPQGSIIPITITVRSDGVDVHPTFANVQNRPTPVRLRWQAAGGATFPTSGCFSWKPTSDGRPSVSSPNSTGATTLESDEYTNDAATQRIWSYSITILDAAQNLITIDPEVNNEPPMP